MRRWDGVLEWRKKNLLPLQRQRLWKSRVYWGAVGVDSAGAGVGKWKHAVKVEQHLTSKGRCRAPEH